MKNKIKAFLFDMDNTIASTEELNMVYLAEYISTLIKKDMKKQDVDFIYNSSWEDVIDFYKKTYDIDLHFVTIRDWIIEQKHEWAKNNTFQLATGINRVFDMPQRKVIVTGSCQTEIDMLINNTGLHDIFEGTIGHDDYDKCKPEPDSYLTALKYLNVKPEEAIAFEDSPRGIESAKRAGVTAVHIKEFSTADRIERSDFTFENFNEFADFFIR